MYESSIATSMIAALHILCPGPRYTHSLCPTIGIQQVREECLVPHKFNGEPIVQLRTSRLHCITRRDTRNLVYKHGLPLSSFITTRRDCYHSEHQHPRSRTTEHPIATASPRTDVQLATITMSSASEDFDAENIFRGNSALGAENPAFGDQRKAGKNAIAIADIEDALLLSSKYTNAELSRMTERSETQIDGMIKLSITKVAKFRGVDRAEVKGAFDDARLSNGVNLRRSREISVVGAVGDSKGRSLSPASQGGMTDRVQEDEDMGGMEDAVEEDPVQQEPEASIVTAEHTVTAVSQSEGEQAARTHRGGGRSLHYAEAGWRAQDGLTREVTQGIGLRTAAPWKRGQGRFELQNRRIKLLWVRCPTSPAMFMSWSVLLHSWSRSTRLQPSSRKVALLRKKGLAPNNSTRDTNFVLSARHAFAAFFPKVAHTALVLSTRHTTMSQTNARSLADRGATQGDTFASLINVTSSPAPVAPVAADGDTSNENASHAMDGSTALDSLFARNPTAPVSQMSLINTGGSIRRFSDEEHENWLLLAAENTFEELMLEGNLGASDDKSKRLKVRNLTERAIRHVAEKLGVNQHSVRNALNQAQIANEVPQRRHALSQQRKKETLKKKEEESSGNQAMASAQCLKPPMATNNATSNIPMLSLPALNSAASGSASPNLPYYGQGLGPLFSTPTPSLAGLIPSYQPDQMTTTQGAWRPVETTSAQTPASFSSSSSSMSADTELELFGEIVEEEEEEEEEEQREDVIGPGQEPLTAEEDCAMSMMKLAVRYMSRSPCSAWKSDAEIRTSALLLLPSVAPASKRVTLIIYMIELPAANQVRLLKIGRWGSFGFGPSSMNFGSRGLELGVRLLFCRFVGLLNDPSHR
ncbi:uncharacterized protein MYCFIDRAFT_171536 [Pseudocercospora fijiensis CIRAD86]|uniref:Uncharacterized protein n=1 Tax=Pseudocercospora fijiensis (strain CIRAD86) TaxID=383855 RepID=M2Z782_PSEFD|nr:uncharacterized protein MYCFIDRAFT_171536 [Pseudocercospora fijiensis CIRAD86]EME85645.1 hypothetical protein MYCFIDRAFT_171536 [Pseudocercospora fijiensis CIRAD86]